jgi:hypothetical protein
MTEMNQEDAVKLETFETFFEQAWIDHYENQPHFVGEMSAVREWSLRDFVTAYREGNYPPGRLSGCLDRVIDFKLQFYYVSEVDLGLYNANYFDRLRATGVDEGNTPPHMLLLRLSQDQNLIGKIRILWERLMNLIYYLENGRDLGGRSKKKPFFRWIDSNAGKKWVYLAPYEAVIEEHDERFRTPEFHKNSTLRKEILEQTLDLNEIMKSIDHFTNGMWDTILQIMRGEPLTRFSTLHFEKDFELYPRYKKYLPR